jgi:hypothetical protein
VIPFCDKGCRSEEVAGNIYSRMYFCTATCRFICESTNGCLFVKLALIACKFYSSRFNCKEILILLSS